MLYEVTKLSSECSHEWRVSRMASAYPCDIPQVLYSTLQNNDPVRRCEHYSHVYTRDVTFELYCIYMSKIVYILKVFITSKICKNVSVVQQQQKKQHTISSWAHNQVPKFIQYMRYMHIVHHFHRTVGCAHIHSSITKVHVQSFTLLYLPKCLPP